MNQQDLKWYSFRWKTGVLLLVCCAGMWYFMRGRFIHPMGTGPAGPAVSAQPFKHIWSNSKVVLLGFGDSVTAGFGASAGSGYFELLAKNDDAKYPEMKGQDLTHVFPKLMLDNESISYTISEEHLRDQIPGVRPFPRNVQGVVVITSGGNDLIHDYGRSAPKDGAMYGCTYAQAMKWKENFWQRLRKIIAGSISKFPGGCEVFVANIYDPTDGIGDIQDAHILLLLHKWKDDERVLGLFNGVIAEVCAEYPNVHMVDIHSAFLGHGIHCSHWWEKNYRKNDPHYWYFENLEDPNDRGYDAVRRLFLNEMIKVFGKPSFRDPSVDVF